MKNAITLVFHKAGNVGNVNSGVTDVHWRYEKCSTPIKQRTLRCEYVHVSYLNFTGNVIHKMKMTLCIEGTVQSKTLEKMNPSDLLYMGKQERTHWTQEERTHLHVSGQTRSVMGPWNGVLSDRAEKRGMMGDRWGGREENPNCWPEMYPWRRQGSSL